MLDPANAAANALQNSSLTSGAFYGSAANLSLGMGLIYHDIRFPNFNIEDRLFDTVAGTVCVLTHECDIDPANNRHFNDCVLVCPIITMAAFVEGMSLEYDDAAVARLIRDISADRVFRVFFLPPYVGSAGENILEHGGFIYLNQICNTHVSEFEPSKARPLCALSTYAAQRLDWKMQNHLLRPKAEQLPRLT